MNRRQAIDIIVKHDLAGLSRDERAAMVLDWWNLDQEDAEYGSLPDVLKAELERGDEPRDPMTPLYDSLIEVGLRDRFVGVKNEYLEYRLKGAGTPVQVEGSVEALAQCPCCGYRTLRRPAEYEICKLCFWEDDGTERLDKISAANHCTLNEARTTFVESGVARERFRNRRLPDGRDRYLRGEAEPHE